MVIIERSSRNEMSTNSKLKIVAAIPCYNTQNHIAEVIAKIKNYVDEVIVIDDGSTDMTASIARTAGASLVSHKINRGYGDSIKSGITLAQANNADIIITIDGDGQHDPDEVPRLLSTIFREDADIVIGSRFLTFGKKMPSYRKFGIGIINHIWNFGAKVRLSDTQSGFRAYTRKMFDSVQLTEKGMSMSIEIIEKARRMGLKIKEVPVTCSYENNNSNLCTKAFRHGVSVAFSVLRIRLRPNIRRKENGSEHRR